MKISYIPYQASEMNDVAFSKKYEYRWTNFLKKELEKNGHTIHTYDITPFEEADAILSFDNVYFQNFKLFKRIFDCNKLGCVTHIDYEPPSANCRIHEDSGLRLLSKLFKNLVTYNDNVISGNIIKGCIGDFFTKEQKYEHDFKDRKLVSIIANYRVNLMLYGQHPNELYSKRAEAVEYFQKKCPNDFDLYGNYWGEKYKRCYVRPVSRNEKISVIKKYKFLISYDSLCNQNGYISEKIFDCFNAKTVPVYWGADNVSSYIPKECFIDKRDFSTYDELYEYLKNMSEERYEEYIINIEKYLHSNEYNELFSSQASASVLYSALMAPSVNRNNLYVRLKINKFNKKRKSNIIYNYSNNYYDYHLPNIVNIKDYVSLDFGGYIDYNLHFEFTSSSNNKLEVYAKYNNKSDYHKLKLFSKMIPGIYNGLLYSFYISVFDVIDQEKISLFVKKDGRYIKLNIETLLDISAIKKYFNLNIKNNTLFISDCSKIEFIGKNKDKFMQKINELRMNNIEYNKSNSYFSNIVPNFITVNKCDFLDNGDFILNLELLSSKVNNYSLFAKCSSQNEYKKLFLCKKRCLNNRTDNVSSIFSLTLSNIKKTEKICFYLLNNNKYKQLNICSDVVDNKINNLFFLNFKYNTLYLKKTNNSLFFNIIRRTKHYFIKCLNILLKKLK